MSAMDHLARAALAGALNSLWMAAALALAAWTLARYLPRNNAATRHLLWWSVLAVLLILPVRVLDRSATRSTPVTVRSVAPAIAPAVFTPAMPRSRQPVFPLRIPAGGWLRLAVGLWLVFAGVSFCRIAWSFLYLRAVKRSAHAAPQSLSDRFNHWLAACEIRRPVRLLVSERIASPMATGFLHPAVILPAALLTQFREPELDHVLLHELAHVDRRDDWTNLAALCLGALAGLHPVAAWVLRQVARERELACDDWVVSRTGEARSYAASLARLFELCRVRRRMMLATGMAGHTSQLGERIEILLRGGRPFTPRASLLRVALTSMALLAMVAVGARAPRWIVLAQGSPARAVPRPAAPVNSHGSFLAALVAGGYGNLPVDEIISLKDHGITAEFLAGISQSGWERMTAGEMIDLHDHGVSPEMLRAVRDAGFTHVEIREVIDACMRGVGPGTLREAAQYGSHLTLAQIVKLKEAGVIR